MKISKEDILDYLNYKKELKLRMDKVAQENVDKSYKELALLSKLEECSIDKEINRNKLEKIKIIQDKDNESIGIVIFLNFLILCLSLLIPICIGSGHDKVIAYFTSFAILLYNVMVGSYTYNLLKLKIAIKKARKTTN